jgi:pimeloyl-ACP methyl ester carboxylesterase
MAMQKYLLFPSQFFLPLPSVLPFITFTMRFCLLLLTFLSVGFFSFGQTYPIGHRTITFNDPARTGGFGSGGGSGRQIQTEVYYPGAASGDNVAVAFGSFPVVVFGHGFQMTWDVYSPIYDSLARKGYIVCCPRTEGGLLPTHTEFAKDLAIVLDKTLAFNTDVNSPFYGRVNGKGAIGGHSMGGGCSFLSAQYTSNETALFNFAAAETNPSAIAQCSTTVSAPLLVIAGSYDVVAPPADNTDPMYAAALSPCKTYFNITGGYHCQFSNVSTQCQFGEGTLFPPSGGPSRTAQLQLTRDVLNPFLDFWLKGICSQWTNLMTIYSTSSAYTTQQSCNVDFPSSASIVPSGPVAICQGASANLSVNAGNYQVLWNNNQTNDTISVNSGGNYTVTLTGSNNCSATSVPVAVSISQPNATITPSGPTIFCEGNSVTLSVPTAASYAWSDGSSASTLTVNQSGTYSVSVTDANGCVASSTTISVTVLDSLIPSILSPDGIQLCGSTALRLQLPDSASYNQILWSNNATTGSISVSQGGQYCAFANNSQGCGGSACISINQGSLPDASFNLGSTPPYVNTQAIDFAANGSDVDYLYSWDFGDGSISSNPTEQHTYSNPGTYTACLDVTNIVTSCAAQTCQTITVDQFIGVSEIAEWPAEIYPNPLSNGQKLTVRIEQKSVFTLYDSYGRKLLETALPAGENQLDLSGFSVGVYFVQLNNQHFRISLR